MPGVPALQLLGAPGYAHSLQDGACDEALNNRHPGDGGKEELQLALGSLAAGATFSSEAWQLKASYLMIAAPAGAREGEDQRALDEPGAPSRRSAPSDSEGSARSAAGALGAVCEKTSLAARVSIGRPIAGSGPGPDGGPPRGRPGHARCDISTRRRRAPRRGPWRELCAGPEPTIALGKAGG